MAELQLLIKCGKDLGFEGAELQKWVEEKEKARKEEEKEKARRDEEREERVALREEKRRRDELELLKVQQRLDDKVQKPAPIGWKPKLPVFNEGVDLIDGYLQRFTVHAESLGWPKEEWGKNLYNLLTGQALQACISFSKEDLQDFDKMRGILLNRFGLTEEGYCQKFHKAVPQIG